MLFLFLSIVCTICIFVLFRIAGTFKVSPLSMLTINYLTAFLTGGIILLLFKTNSSVFFTPGFIVLTIATGIMFVAMFLFIQFSVNKIGVSISTSATKFSVVFPVFISIIIDPNDIFTFNKLFGILLILMSILLILHKKNKSEIDSKTFFLPALLFVFAGVVDSVVKIIQQYYLDDKNILDFMIWVFLVSFFTCIALLIFKKSINQVINKKNIIFGLLFGLVNFGGLFFLIKTLNLNINREMFLDSSRIFLFNNIGIILGSVLIGITFFKEKLTIINFLGIGISLAGFYFLKNSN